MLHQAKIDGEAFDIHHSRNHTLVFLALRDTAQIAGKFDNLGTLRGGSHGGWDEDPEFNLL